MKLFRHLLNLRPLNLNHGGATSMANEAIDDATPLTGLCNEITADRTADGWALIKYGVWPNERGLQRFAREDAEKMVGYFKGTWNMIKRAFVGMPIFRGHPDLAEAVSKERDREKDPAKRSRLTALVNEFSRRWSDKTVYGTVADMEAREEGLAIKPILTEEGAALVNERGLKWFSPHWLGLPLPKTPGGPEHACVLMRSIGLTDNPNIAGTSLVNSQPENPDMNKFILALLAALGRPLANEATESQITEALTAAVPVATALLERPESTALANEQSARTTLEGQLTAEKERATGLDSQISDLNSQLSAAATALANERKAHAGILVDVAIKDGRVTEAQKPVWLSRLERDFAAECTALANTAPTVKTTARTLGMGGRKESSDAATQFTALVNEAMPKHGGDRDAAWAAIKLTPTGKALFEQMSQEK